MKEKSCWGVAFFCIYRWIERITLSFVEKSIVISFLLLLETVLVYSLGEQLYPQHLR